MEQNQGLKKDLSEAHRHLTVRNERITDLEALVQQNGRQLKEQEYRFGTEVRALKEALSICQSALPFLSCSYCCCD